MSRDSHPLGVIEALTAVRDQCPHAQVRQHATDALEAVRREGGAVLAQQAFLVLSTIGGWRGERALEVKRALRAFLDTAPRDAG